MNEYKHIHTHALTHTHSHPSRAPSPLGPFFPAGSLRPCVLSGPQRDLTKSPLRAQRPFTLKGPSPSLVAAKTFVSDSPRGPLPRLRAFPRPVLVNQTRSQTPELKFSGLHSISPPGEPATKCHFLSSDPPEHIRG